MIDATVTTALPVLTLGTVAYRSIELEHALFDRTYTAHDLVADSAVTPDSLHRAGWAHTARALSIWNEAHNENARIDNERNWAVDAVDPAIAELQQRLDSMTELATSRGIELDRLRNEQISGDDPRLSDFWQSAAELADEAGHCGVYDQLAEQLGGTRRAREYRVTVPVTVQVTVSVTARDADDAVEDAANVLSDYEIREAVSYGNWEADWEEASAERDD